MRLFKQTPEDYYNAPYDEFPALIRGTVVVVMAILWAFSKLMWRWKVEDADLLFERQQAAASLANRCDCMVVVGGKNSGNTRRLAQICAAACERTHHIEEASELEAEWFANAQHIGITAGASTPQEHIERAVTRIKELCR